MKDKNLATRLKDIKHLIDQSTLSELLTGNLEQIEKKDSVGSLAQIESAEGNEKVIHKEHINRLKKPRKRRRIKRD
jgi:hypothetical protein